MTNKEIKLLYDKEEKALEIYRRINRTNQYHIKNLDDKINKLKYQIKLLREDKKNIIKSTEKVWRQYDKAVDERLKKETKND